MSGAVTRRGSALSLLPTGTDDSILSPPLPDAFSIIKSPTTSMAPQQLVRIFWRQYIGLAAIILLLIYTEGLQPYQHVLYTKSDNESFKYSYPLLPNTMAPWAVPVVAVLSPLLLILTFFLTNQITVIEANHAFLAALTCVAVTGITTNFIKVNVGRFRPHFLARCWPDGAVHTFDVDGRPICSDASINPLEGMKSFPSGHTAWSTSGLAYCSLWLMGKLACFNGGGPLRLAVSLAPLSGAVWVGASRLQDYWHHWEDIVVGFMLGFLMAFLFYRTCYCSIFSEQAGCLSGGLSSPVNGSNGLLNGTREKARRFDGYENGGGSGSGSLDAGAVMMNRV